MIVADLENRALLTFKHGAASLVYWLGYECNGLVGFLTLKLRLAPE